MNFEVNMITFSEHIMYQMKVLFFRHNLEHLEYKF